MTDLKKLAAELDENGILITAEELEGISDRSLKRLNDFLEFEDQPLPLAVLHFCSDPDEHTFGGDQSSTIGDLLDLLELLDVDFDHLAIANQFKGINKAEFSALESWLQDHFEALADDDTDTDLPEIPLPWLEAFFDGEQPNEPEPAEPAELPKSAEAIPAQGPERPAAATSKVETRQQAISRIHAEIHEARKRLQRSIAVAEEAKAESAEAKKHAETCQAKVNSLVAELDEAAYGDFQPQLAFPADDPAEQAAEQSTGNEFDPWAAGRAETPTGSSGVDLEANTIQPTQEDNKPETTSGDLTPGEDSIERLELTPAQRRKLNAIDVATVAELQAAINDGRVEALQGIGPTAVEKMRKAVADRMKTRLG